MRDQGQPLNLAFSKFRVKSNLEYELKPSAKLGNCIFNCSLLFFYFFKLTKQLLIVGGESNRETWNIPDMVQVNSPSKSNSSTTTIKLSPVTISNISPPSLTISRKNLDVKQIPYKRPNVGILSENSKRMKSSTAVTFSPKSVTSVISSSLLQQLINPSVQSQKIRIQEQEEKNEVCTTGDEQRRNGNGVLRSSTENFSSKLPIQASNSVLMNLLVSGCDVSSGYTCFPRPTKVAKA